MTTNIGVVVTDADIQRWCELKQKKSEIEAEERDLRAKIVAAKFSAPVEGTNKVDMPNGYTLKLNYKLDRKIDVAILTNIAPELRKAKVDLDELIEAKPQLKVGAYRKLGPKELALFNQCVTTKVGSPTLELVAPKK